MHIARGLFAQWQIDLETEPEWYALRLFAPGGGLVWRNAAACQHYEKLGFFAAPIMSWEKVCTYLTRRQQAEIEAQYLEAFRTGETVEFIHTSQAPGHAPQRSTTRVLWVYGNMTHGVALTQLLPCAVSDAILPLPIPALEGDVS